MGHPHRPPVGIKFQSYCASVSIGFMNTHYPTSKGYLDLSHAIRQDAVAAHGSEWIYLHISGELLPLFTRFALV